MIYKIFRRHDRERLTGEPWHTSKISMTNSIPDGCIKTEKVLPIDGQPDFIDKL